MTEQEAPPTTPPQEIPEPPPHPESGHHTPMSVPEAAPEISGIVAGPWLRFFARSVDIQIWSVLLAFTAGLLLPALFADNAFLTGQLGSRLFGWALVPFALALDAAAYSVFGNTPGKFTAGIKVKSLAGDKVSFSTYLKRNFGMYWFGLGADIPIVVLVTMWSNYGRAEGNEAVRWDESAATRPFVKAASTPRFAAIAAIWVLLLAWELSQLVTL